MSASATIASTPQVQKPLFAEWSSRRSYLLLAAATLLCLLPFSGRAFHIDDPLFVWSGQQIAKHPLDPYGFQVTWDNYPEPMSEITKNPPLACYYAALIGSVAGWSERALHLGFLLPTLAFVLGTYRLAERFTRSPLVAASATLLTPGILVSASSVMCDTMMLAFWIWAAIFWIEGTDENKPVYLATSSFLLACAALTKYFGIALLPLLLLYSLGKKRRLGWWVLYFLIPLSLLAAYQLWTSVKYGHAMFSQAFDFAHSERAVNGKDSPLASAFICASFVGGCTSSVLFFGPLLWRWKKLVSALLLGAICTAALALGWVHLGHSVVAMRVAFRASWTATGIQLMLAIATGIVVIALGISELRNWRAADSSFLGFWVLGTFVFAAFVNWSVNARSVMPLIPTTGILLARRFDKLNLGTDLPRQRMVALVLLLSGALSLWVVRADSEWANSARQAAELIRQQDQSPAHAFWFEGHWGFQYYMQLWGAHPVDFLHPKTSAGDVLVVPDSMAVSYTMPSPQFIASTDLLEIKLNQPLSTMYWRRGAGFYSSFFGPLPFVFAPSGTERYYLLRLATPWSPHLVRRTQN